MLKTVNVTAACTAEPVAPARPSACMLRLATTTALATGVIAGMMLFQPNAALAQVVWSGATDTNAVTGTNWAGGAAPTAADAALLNNGVVQQPTLVDVTTYLSLGVTAGTYTIGAGGVLTATNGISTTGTGTLAILASGAVIGNVSSAGNGSNAGAITGNLGVAGGLFTNSGTVSGATTVTGGTLLLATGSNLADAGALTINGASAVVNIQAVNETVGSVSLQAGSITGTAGVLTSTAAFDVQSGTASAILGGTSGLTKTTAGTVTLSGANTYAGATTVTAGVLNIQNASALGATGVGNGTTVAAGAALELQGSITVGPEALTLNGTGVTGGGALRNVSGVNTYSGPITLGSNTSIASAADRLVVTGGVALGGSILTLATGTFAFNTVGLSGVGGLVVGNGAPITVAFFDVASSYTGGTTINGFSAAVVSAAGGLGTGIVTLAGGSLVGAGAGLTLTNAISVTGPGSSINNASLAGRSLTLTGGIALGSNSLLFDDNNAGNTVTASGVISGAGGVNKSGAATLVLSGTNTFTGVTTVSGGTLTTSGQIVGGLVNGAIVNASGVVNGGVVNAAGGTFNVVGGLTGTAGFANAGTLNVTGGNYAGLATLANTGAATVAAGRQLGAGVITNAAGATFATAGTVAATTSFTNAGAVNAAGTLTAPLLTNSGTFTLTGALGGGIAVFNNNVGGTLAAGAQSLSGIGTLNNSGAVTVLAGGSLAANAIVQNAGSFGNAGTVTAATISNAAGATFATTGTVAATTSFTTAGAVNAAGTLNTPLLTNSGTFTLTGPLGGAIAAFTNNAGGTLAVGGQTLSGIGTLTNSGLVQVGAGTLNAATIANLSNLQTAGTVNTTTLLDNRAGATVTARGAITSPLVQNRGAFNTNGALQINGAFSNLVGGTASIGGGTLSVSQAATNGGSLTIGNTLTANLGSLSNTGTVTLGSGSVLRTAAGLANNGTLNAINGFAGDRIIVGNGISGNGAVGIDIDTGARTADTIAVSGGASSGLQNVTLSQGGNPNTILTNDLGIVSGAVGAQFVAANAIATSQASPFQGGGGQLINNLGLVQYWFGETQPNSGNFVVRPDLNVAAASSFVASVSSALSSINAFSEPASAFISGPADPAANTFSIGSWGRGRGGQLDIISNSSVVSQGGVTRSFRSNNEAGFHGFQIGIDAGLYNINGSGWSANVGVHGGKVDAEIKSPDTKLDVSQPFYGVYAALRSGSGFTFDVLVRRDNFDLKLNAPGVGLNEKFKADGWSGLVSLAQRFSLSETVYIDPSVALLYSRAEVDTLRSGLVTVDYRPIESITGRLGVQIGTILQPTETLVVSPYVAFSVWHEFANATQATGSFGTLSFPTTTDRVGTYAQASLGVAVSSTTPGLSGFVRGDMRFGQQIQGYALNGGLRYQF